MPARPAHHFHNDLAVDGVLQRVELDDGVAVFVAGIECDGAAGQGALQRADGETKGDHGELADGGIGAAV